MHEGMVQIIPMEAWHMKERIRLSSSHQIPFKFLISDFHLSLHFNITNSKMPPIMDTAETPIIDDILDGVPDAETSMQEESNGAAQTESNGDSMAVAIRKVPKGT
jgi:hypothetical protein